MKVFYPLYTVAELMILYDDGRSLSEIAADWEGAERIIATDENSGKETSYDGFTLLKRIVREEGELVQIGLVKGGTY